jgi:2,3-bisphosphoglycerate-dependent phosphoglycerate mutase
MKNFFGVLILTIITNVLLAQESVITTFILVRHAEKDLTQSTNDPDLSADGKNRATRLNDLLRKTDVTAIYSTPYKRTQQTVAAVATEKGLTINTYQANKMEEIDNLIRQHAGGTILLSGHSNTTPAVLNYLTGEEKYKIFDDSDYGNVIIVSLTTRGKNVKVTWLRY